MLHRDEKLGSVWNRAKARITSAGLEFDGSGVGSTMGVATDTLREALKAVKDDLPGAFIPKKAWSLHEIYSYLIREKLMEKEEDEKLVQIPEEPLSSGKVSDQPLEKPNEERSEDEVMKGDLTSKEDDLRFELDNALSSSRIDDGTQAGINNDNSGEKDLLENTTEKAKNKQQEKEKDIEKLNESVLKLQAGVQSIDYGKIGERLGKSIAPVIASHINKINTKNTSDLKGIVRQITAEQIRPVIKELNGIKSSIDEVKEAVRKLEKKQEKGVEDEEEDEPDWCSYCEVSGHNLENCHEIPEQHWCIRCLDEQHKETNCPLIEDMCKKCSSIGHTEDLHDVKDLDMRAAIVTFHGADDFKEDFFEKEKEDSRKRKSDEIIIKKEKFSKPDRFDNHYDGGYEGDDHYVDDREEFYDEDMYYEGTKSFQGPEGRGRGDHGRGDRGRGDRGRGGPGRGRGDRGRGDRGRGGPGRGDRGRGNRGSDRGRGGQSREPRGRGSVPLRRPYQAGGSKTRFNRIRGGRY